MESSAPPSPSRKRKLEDMDGPDSVPQPVGTSSTTASLMTPPMSYSNHSSPSKLAPAVERATSPSSSSLTSISGDQLDGAPSGNSVAGAVPQKRRKLTPAERLLKEQEKETKAKERAEAKAKREEERRVEEEEKQRKRAEREEKKRQREFEDQQKKQQRDLAKQKEEEEKEKKERSQMRLNAFFTNPRASPMAAPTNPAKNSSPPEEGLPGGPKPNNLKPPENAVLAALSPAKPVLSEFERRFLPFSLPANSVMAPVNHFHDTLNNIDGASERVEQDVGLSNALFKAQVELAVAFRVDSSVDGHCGSDIGTVEDIVTQLHGTPIIPTALTQEAAGSTSLLPLQQLKHIPLKYIHFEQDVRPAYYGTYTRMMAASQSKRLARNAWSRNLPDTDYDYDSEAEWEEPEEGEDILSDGEDDGESLEGDDDMEGFLDDENDSPRKKRLVLTTELEPESSGLCWEDTGRRMKRGDDSDLCPTFHGFRLGMLLQDPPATIDPFCTSYWAKEVKTIATCAAPTSKGNDSTAMQPPARVPLNPILNGGNSKIMEDFTGKPSTPPVVLNPTKRGPGRPPKADTPGKVKRMVPPEHMEEFRGAINGSDLTKIALIEDLKKRFPKLPKDAINNTLSTVAARIGAREVEKRWVLL